LVTPNFIVKSGNLNPVRDEGWHVEGRPQNGAPAADVAFPAMLNAIVGSALKRHSGK
jgi:hypothetical protein